MQESTPFSHEMIRQELNRVLECTEFSRSEYLCRFLRCCVEETLSGNISQLKEFWLGRSVFLRETGFDPSADPIVRVQARRMRQKLGRYYDGEGRVSPLRIVLPVGSYVPQFVPSVPVQTANSAASKTLSLAVLPFADLEQTGPGERFAAILTHELIHSMVETGKFLVVSRLSSSRFKESGGDVRAIGKALNADFLIEGSVRGEDSVRQVGVQLTDAGSGYHLWSASFECTGGFQSGDGGNVVRRIAGLLESRLTV